MKIIRIHDVVHQQLKREARANGRTLQWWAEYRLTGEEPKAQTLTSNLFPGDSPEAKKLAKTVEPRSKADIHAEIDALTVKTKEDLEYCQDPEERRKIEQASQAGINALWGEYHVTT